jgi:hypothetical protein
MCSVIDNIASCEILAVIRFLHAKNMSAAEIHWELCMMIYGQNVRSNRIIIQWYRMIKDKLTNVPDEGRSGRPSVVNDDDVQSVKDVTSQFQNFCVNFHKFQELSSMRLSQLG